MSSVLHFGLSNSSPVHRYLKEPKLDPDADPIEWWSRQKSKYPTLWRMAHDLLAIPATSTPSECSFSHSGEMFSSRRKCLHGETAQALLNVGSWWDAEDTPGIDAPIVQHKTVNRSYKANRYLPLAFSDENGKFKIMEGQDDDHINDALEDAGCDE